MPNYQLRISSAWNDFAHGGHNEEDRIGPRVHRLAIRIGCANWIAYEHPATIAKRVHCHIYFFDATYKIQTVRDNIVVYLTTHDNVGNKIYSLSETAGRNKGPITLSGAIKYASRDGTLTASMVAGYDAQIIRRMESDFQVPDPEPEEKNEMIMPLENKRIHQMTKWHLVDICLGEYNQFKKMEQREPRNRELVNMVIEVLRGQNQVFSKYKVQEILYTIRANTDAYELENDLVKYLDSI